MRPTSRSLERHGHIEPPVITCARKGSLVLAVPQDGLFVPPAPELAAGKAGPRRLDRLTADARSTIQARGADAICRAAAEKFMRKFMVLLVAMAASGCGTPAAPSATADTGATDADVQAADAQTGDAAADAVADTKPNDTSDIADAAADTGPADAGPVDSGPADTGPADTGPDVAPADAAIDVAPVDSGSDSGAQDVVPTGGCAESGGTVGESLCCQSAGDFPNNCLIGACGCAPAYSHTIKVCNCAAGKCWDGTTCKTM